LTKLASRRRRRKTIGRVVSDVERRIRVVEKRPGAKRLKRNVVTAEKIQYRSIVAKNVATDGITPNEVSFGTPIVSETEPTEYLKDGTLWVDPTDGASAIYDQENEDFVPLSAEDPVARASADGKNTIYRQDNQPTGGTYVTGDTWFDTNDDNKIYRYNGTSWIGFTLGNNALASISANKITAGTIDASVITVSNLDAGNITTGSLSATRIGAGTISASIEMTSATITGGLIRTSASGERIEISNLDQVNFYNSSGTISGRISPYAEAGYDSGLHVGDGTGSFSTGLYISSDYVNLSVDSQASLSFLPGGTSVLSADSVLTVTSGSLLTLESSVLVSIASGSSVITLDGVDTYLDNSSSVSSFGLRNISGTTSLFFTPSTDTSGGIGDVMLVYTA
jgi:hypothetical protein